MLITYHQAQIIRNANILINCRYVYVKDSNAHALTLSTYYTDEEVYSNMKDYISKQREAGFEIYPAPTVSVLLAYFKNTTIAEHKNCLFRAHYEETVGKFVLRNAYDCIVGNDLYDNPTYITNETILHHTLEYMNKYIR